MSKDLKASIKSEDMLKKIMAKAHRPVYKSRMACLSKAIIPYLSENDKVLDVGCGFGEFSDFIMRSKTKPKGLSIIGVEKQIRPDCLIEVEQLIGDILPFADNSFNCVMILDVLHHEQNWTHLLNECIRVSKNLIIIKDHKVSSKSSYYHICLLDWLANKPYSIECFYDYFTLAKWRAIFIKKKLQIIKEELSMNLYPYIYQILFPGKLQYFSVLKKSQVV